MEIFRVICIKVVIDVVEVEGFSNKKKKKKRAKYRTKSNAKFEGKDQEETWDQEQSTEENQVVTNGQNTDVLTKTNFVEFSLPIFPVGSIGIFSCILLLICEIFMNLKVNFANLI